MKSFAGIENDCKQLVYSIGYIGQTSAQSSDLKTVVGQQCIRHVQNRKHWRDKEEGITQQWVIEFGRNIKKNK